MEIDKMDESNEVLRPRRTNKEHAMHGAKCSYFL